MFGRLNRIFVTPALSVAPQTAYASHVAEHAASRSSDLIILPLTAGLSSDDNQPSNGSSQSLAVAPTASYNPFQALFGGQTSSATPLDSSLHYSQYIREVFAKARCDVALIIDRGLPSENLDTEAIDANIQHLFLPFFGGPDDRLALAFVLQICGNNPAVSATIIRVSKSEGLFPVNSIDSVVVEKEIAQSNDHAIINGIPDTIYGPETTETRLTSQTADHLAWTKAKTDQTPPSVTFHQLESPNPLHETIGKMSSLLGPGTQNKGLLVVCGRSRRLAVESHEVELRRFATEHKASQTGALRKTVGDVATAFVVSTSHPLLVLQGCALSTDA